MTLRLQGKIALVIGAARGIGEGIAQRFVEEGARVVIADTEIDAGKDTAKRLGGLFIATDISQFDQAQRAVQTALDGYGALDILVQNAGTFLSHLVLVQSRCPSILSAGSFTSPTQLLTMCRLLLPAFRPGVFR